MTRTEAAHSVRERWERLGIGTPEEFPHVFSSDVDNLLEELSSTGNILDVADQGKANILALNTCASVNEGGEATAIASPLYLLASEIVDVVEFAAQYRAEEEAAAEEGALIEASNMPYPEFERNGR